MPELNKNTAAFEVAYTDINLKGKKRFVNP